MAAVVGALLVDVDGEVEAGVGVGGEGNGEGHYGVHRSQSYSGYWKVKQVVQV